MNKSTVPNSASFKSKFALMVGILEAQEEKQKPDRKKNTLRKKRCLFLGSIVTPCRAQISD
jgi:hypothetical protein